jgi:hypothetical protein
MPSMSSSERSPSSTPWGRLVAILAALTALLAVVALASRGHKTPVGGGGTSRAPSQVIADVVFTLLICAMALTVIFLAYMRTLKRAEVKAKPGAARGTLIGLVYLAVLGGLGALAADRARQHHYQRLLNIPHFAGTGARQSAQPRHPRSPEFEWPLAAGLAALGVAAVAVPLVRRRLAVRQHLREQRIAETLARVLDESLDDLHGEADPRRAVIAAYARMERTLAGEGLGRHVSEAPFEYLARVLAELQASRRSAFALTELYGRAEFSSHSVDEEMKREAISARTALRNDLAAAAA